MANVFGDFISGLGYAASGALGRPIQIVPGGLGQRISGSQNPQVWNPYSPTGSFAQEPLISPAPSSGPIGQNIPVSTPQYQAPAPQPTPQPQPQPQSSSGGGEDFLNYYQGWNPDAARRDFQQVFGGDTNALRRSRGIYTADELMQQAEQAYQPAITALGQAETSARTGSQESLDKILADYNSYLSDLGNQETNLKAGQAEQERLVGQAGQSAAEEARRNFNLLKQQGMSRFGASSSTGPSVGEIAAQEFARTQGRLGEAGIAAQQQLSLEAGRLNTFVSQKKNDLLRWKTGTEDQIRQNLQATLDNINLRRGEVESAKSQARINVINQARAELEKINTQFYNTRAALALSAIQNGQQIAGRAFTPQEQATIWNQVFAQQLTGVGAAGVTPQMTAPVLAGRRRDQFGNLISPFGNTP